MLAGTYSSSYNQVMKIRKVQKCFLRSFSKAESREHCHPMVIKKNVLTVHFVKDKWPSFVLYTNLHEYNNRKLLFHQSESPLQDSQIYCHLSI